jgi:hypothetical protein
VNKLSVFSGRSDTAGGVGNRRIVSLFALFGAALAVCLIVWFLMPAAPVEPQREMPPNPFADPAAGVTHIRKLAATYGNHFERLSVDDQTFLNSIAMGHGRELLAKTVDELKVNPSGAGGTGRPGSSQTGTSAPR